MSDPALNRRAAHAYPLNMMLVSPVPYSDDKVGGHCLSPAVLTATLLLSCIGVFAAETQVQRDIPYAEPSHERRSLDVYSPAEGDNHPIVVWVHGGAWRIGSKDSMELKPQVFTEQGCVFIPINYRFVPDATIGEIAGDVAKAIAWAHRHGRKYRGDPAVIFAMGHSAGAQLVALVSTDESYLQAEGLSLAHLKGCVPIDGNTYDVVHMVKIGEARQTRPYFDSHRRLFGHEAMQQHLSAVNHVAPDKGIPPFLILHVEDYTPITRTGLQAHLLRSALTEQGRISVKIRAIPGKTHQSINSEIGMPDDAATRAIFAFIRKQVGASKEGLETKKKG